MIFSFYNYGSLCQKIKAEGISCVIKHDVETVSDSTVEIAKIEARHGLSAIYFFQYDVFLNSSHHVRELQSLGHEIGYHYDVLDNNLGDLPAAILEFERNLESFAEFGCRIKWICPHGNPALKRTGWSSNKDFFRNRNVRSRFKELKDIVVDFSHHFPKYLYISDVGYGFKIVGSISNNDQIKSVDTPVENIFQLIHDRRSSGFVISTHPHRWVGTACHFIAKRSAFYFLKNFYNLTHRIFPFSIIYKKMFRLSRRF